ncbi:hypothetical protein RFN58_41925 [Streptomyces iakyrus]|uniref:hypothetical protein n=1 Tax=Streptomyces iakyrus TaxID=68219 RepID=UPI000525B10A|nr:hypothetical protein [Streptomyces iakyrus]
MNRNAGKPYPVERIHQTLSDFARRLGIRDSAGRLVDFARTHRFRHTKANFLRNRKITADARELATDPRDLWVMLELDKRSDRNLPNGPCLLPPRHACAKGRQHLPDLRQVRHGRHLPARDSAPPSSSTNGRMRSRPGPGS